MTTEDLNIPRPPKGADPLIAAGLQSNAKPTSLVGDAEVDFLIAGSANFDPNDTALNSILAEQSSNRDYTTRLDNQMGNGNGASVATRLNDTVFLKPVVSKATLLDDGGRDVLTDIAVKDWLIFNTDGLAEAIVYQCNVQRPTSL